MIKISGIEGPDLPFHLTKLGLDFELVEQGNFHFVPLVDHYNHHSSDYFDHQQQKASASRYAVLYDLLNIGDTEVDQYARQVLAFEHPNKIYLTVNQSDKIAVDCDVVHWDFMYNRFLAYYFDNPQINGLHHYTPGAYVIPRIDYEQKRSRDFISLYRRRDQQRDRLYQHVCNHNGYVSNFPAGISLDDLSVPGFRPIDNGYYQDSYFSIYVESNYRSTDLVHVTEKTYEPLLKAHMILPVTNSGSIKYLQSLGFEFDSIQTRYDNIVDYEQRFCAILAQFDQLVSQDVQAVYRANLHCIKHNQSVFKQQHYDRRILEIFER